jgi:hypothetical protein
MLLLGVANLGIYRGAFLFNQYELFRAKPAKQTATILVP